MEQRMVLEIYERYRHSLYRICLFYMKHEADALDAMQNTLLKLLESDRVFDGEEHVRNWLFRVAANECKTMLAGWWRQHLDISEYSIPVMDQAEHYVEHQAMIDSLMKLPKKCRVVLYLYYYEAYSTVEIASILGMKETAVRAQLARGRKRLKKEFE